MLFLIKEPQQEAIDEQLDEIRSRVPPCGQLERVRSNWQAPPLPVLVSYAWAF